MLLVRNYKSKFFETYVRRNKCMRTYYKIYCPARKFSVNSYTLRFSDRSCEERSFYSDFFKKRLQLVIMLSCKYLCRRHKCSLHIIFYSGIYCSCRTNCFPASDISCKNTAHRRFVSTAHIIFYLRNRSFLRAGKLKTNAIKKRFIINFAHWKGNTIINVCF